MIELHIYGILAFLEVLLLVSVLAGYLYVCNRRNTRTIARLSQSLRQQPAAPPSVKPAPTPPPDVRTETHAYSDFLREELDASSLMLGSDPTPEMEGETDPGAGSQQELVREMLAARHQFLQLELDAQAMDADPEARRQHIVQQMQHLLATFTPAAAETAEEDEAGKAAGTLAREQQLESQLAHLRTVVGNQQDVMRELRDQLEKEMGESEEMRDIIAKLQDAEARSLELERSLEGMDRQTPAPGEQGQGSVGPQGAHASPDSDMLRALVGNQQQTINKLQNMLKQSVGEKEASVELRDAMEKIQRSNQELGTCVMVLEDENSLLREQIESLQSQLENSMGEKTDPPAAQSAAPAEAAAPEPEADASTEDAESPPAVEVDERQAPAAETSAEETAAAGSDDVDALLEAAAPQPPPAVGVESEAAEVAAVERTSTDATLADEDSDAADTGINTLRDIGLDPEEADAPVSDEDIDDLISNPKQD